MKTRAFLVPAVMGALSLVVACSGGGKNGSADSSGVDTTISPMDTMAMDTPAVDTTWYEAAHAELSGTKADTTVNGTAHFTKTGLKVTMTLTLTVPKKAGSTVAVHIHDHGDCGNMGEGAHGHWNPTGENHGKWGAAAYHSGDIGNVKLDKNGKGTLAVETDRWTIGGPAMTNILNHAIIVHAGVDDFTTQPSGNAGSRIGCGVIAHL